MRLRMGTRGSPLALAQSGLAARALEKLHPGLSVETVTITTSGDRFQTAAPGAERAIPGGAKGLFVKEIEEALLKGEIDFAVHSGKDLPAELAAGLTIAAWPEREDPRDVFIGRGGLKWREVKSRHKIGTTALRRAIQLGFCRPGVGVVPMRGNVDTRLRKLAEGACDGLLLAAAGLKRLGRLDPAFELIPAQNIVPAPAQGALALEVRADREDVVELVGRLDHAATRRAVVGERAFMKALGGSCSAPLGVWIRDENEGLGINVFWSREDGSGQVKFETSTPDRDSERLGRSAADRVRKMARQQ